MFKRNTAARDAEVRSSEETFELQDRNLGVNSLNSRGLNLRAKFTLLSPAHELRVLKTTHVTALASAGSGT